MTGSTQIAVRLPDDLLAAIDALVPGRHGSRADAVRRALDLYLARLAAERDAELYESHPLTDDETSFSADPRNWEGTQW